MESKEERLLKAIFSTEDEADENYQNTTIEKVGYAEHVMIHALQDISPALLRLTRLHRLLMVSEKDGQNTLPDIITNNEVRMALNPLLRIEQDIKEITEMLVEIYKDTKPEDKKLKMREGEKSCENCGNTRCANSAVAYNWDECVDSNFTKHWVPKGGTA